MPEEKSPIGSKVVMVAVAAVLVLAAIAYVLTRGGASEPDGAGGPGSASSKGSARYGSGSGGAGIGAKSSDKSDDERVAGEAPGSRRESQKQMVARVSAQAAEQLKMIEERSREFGDDAIKKERLKLLVQAENHWKMAEEVAKNPSLRGQAAAFNRKLAKWVTESGGLDQETFDAQFMALRKELGELRSRNRSGRR